MDFTFGSEERRHFRETIEPLRDDTGKIVGVIGAATDITEQQHTQQQLTAELDFRERMMGILGHDLRNPLGTIAMASDLLAAPPGRGRGGRGARSAAAHPPRGRPHAGDDRHAAGLHARALPGQGPGDARAGRPEGDRARRARRAASRLAGPRDRPAGKWRFGRRMGSGPDGADDHQSGRERDRLRRARNPVDIAIEGTAATWS